MDKDIVHQSLTFLHGQLYVKTLSNDIAFLAKATFNKTGVCHEI